MKNLCLILMLLVLVACAGTLPPEAQKISSVSDTSKCTFIKNDVVDTMQPYKQIFFVQRVTYNAGGDSYKILSTSDYAVPGLSNSRSYMINFEIWKCKK